EFISPREVEAAIGASKALFKLGRYDESLSLTGRALKEANTSVETKLEVHTIRYVILQQTGDRLESVRSLVYLAENHSNQTKKEKYRIRALEIVDSSLKEDQLQTIANESEFAFLRGPALFRVGLNYFEQRDYGRAEKYFNDL